MKKVAIIVGGTILGIFVALVLFGAFLEALGVEPSNAKENSTPVKATPAPAAKNESQNIGETAKLKNATVTIYSLEDNAVPEDRHSHPKDGKRYMVADVEGCANNNAQPNSVEMNPFYFEMQMPDNTRVKPNISEWEPALHQQELSPGDCVRGFVTYQVPIGQAPKYIHFDMAAEPQEKETRWVV